MLQWRPTIELQLHRTLSRRTVSPGSRQLQYRSFLLCIISMTHHNHALKGQALCKYIISLLHVMRSTYDLSLLGRWSNFNLTEYICMFGTLILSISCIGHDHCHHDRPLMSKHCFPFILFNCKLDRGHAIGTHRRSFSRTHCARMSKRSMTSWGLDSETPAAILLFTLKSCFLHRGLRKFYLTFPAVSAVRNFQTLGSVTILKLSLNTGASWWQPV